MKSLIIATLVLALAGCSKNATFTPDPHSTESPLVIHEDARNWVNKDPDNRFYAPVAPTGSMAPVIGDRTLALCLRYTGQPIRNGTIAVYHYSDQYPRMLHVVADQTDDSVYMSGYANSHSDGWHPKSAIEGFLVGQLYLP